METRWMLLIAFATAVSTGISAFFSYTSYKRSKENLSIEISDTDFLISKGDSHITWQGDVDIYNLSSENVSLSQIAVTGSFTYPFSEPDRATYRLGSCEDVEQKNTVVRPRTSLIVNFSCRIRGGLKATKFLEAYLSKSPSETDADEFLKALYKEKKIDFFDEILPEDLDGSVSSVSYNQARRPESGTIIWVPFRFIAITRTENRFETPYFVFLGASSNR